MRAMLAFALIFLAAAAPAQTADPWRSFRDASVVEILTTDANGIARETKVWIVVLKDAGFVRTNDSQWLANIRRGSDVSVRSGETTLAVRVSEIGDAGIKAAVEDAFKAKYGVMQRVMSALRLREPTVLRLHAK